MMIISTGMACAILVGGFLVLVLLRIPVAFALGLATVPVVVLDLRLTPFILLDRMFQSYNSFILLAVPFFLLAANLMNSGKITDRMIDLAKVMTGWLPGGLGHVNVVVSMLFAGISGSSTADAAGCGKILIPAMKREGFDARFAVAITAYRHGVVADCIRLRQGLWLSNNRAAHWIRGLESIYRLYTGVAYPYICGGRYCWRHSYSN